MCTFYFQIWDHVCGSNFSDSSCRKCHNSGSCCHNLLLRSKNNSLFQEENCEKHRAKTTQSTKDIRWKVVQLKHYSLYSPDNFQIAFFWRTLLTAVMGSIFWLFQPSFYICIIFTKYFNFILCVCTIYHILINVHSRRKRGAGGGGGGGQPPPPPPPPNNLSGGIPFGPPIIHPPFLQFLCETGKNHKCTKLKGKIIINVTLIWFEDAGKTIPLNSVLEFSIISDFKMRNVII